MSMTENEAISYLRMATDEAGNEEFSDVYKEMCQMAIQALEEIQAYRAIGTVEELEAMKKGTLSAMELSDIWCVLEDLKKYSAIGTIEEFKALKEKSEPKKILRFEDGDKCPICNHWVGFRYDYCDGCGNALDWK